MKMYNILVTGVGAVIGYGIINSLKMSKYNCNIIGIDIYDDAVGKYMCDTFVQAIPASDERYIGFVKSIIHTHKIDLMMFGTEQEIVKIAHNREQFGTDIDKIVLNKQDLIDMCSDKWLTFNELNDKCDYMIPSYIEGSFQFLKDKLDLPFLLKPRRSYASKGITTIYDEKDLDYWKMKTGDQFMVQPIIGDNDHEYTVGIFGYGDGTTSKPISLCRKLSGEGATAKAYTIFSDELEQTVFELCKLTKPIGPTNFQFRSSGNKYYLLEINPRISSSTSIRSAFGYNEAEMCIDYFVNRHKPDTPQIQQGSCVRYISDWIQK